MVVPLRRRLRWAVLSLLVTSLPALAAEDPADTRLGLSVADRDAPGHAVYAGACAQCHDTGVARAPHPRMLQFMAPETIYRALTEGVMQPQAAALSDEQKRQVAEYLTSRAMGSLADRPEAPVCRGRAARFDWREPPSVPNWGLTWGNTRHAAEPGFGPGDVANLRLKWAFAFPDAQRARSHPLLAGGALYTGSQNGTVFALDRDTGCVRWTFEAGAEVRTGIVGTPFRAGDRRAPFALYFGDLLGDVYAVNGRTGELIWQAHPDDHPASTITGTPTYHEGRLYVPVSSLEVVSATDSGYACCTFRGSVVAYDAATGERLWQTHTVAEAPTLRGKNPVGTDRYGPSGAPVWNSPAIDAKRGVLYVGTGENYSSPATGTSDAILAIELETGRVRWVYQATPNDAWNSACMREERHNCPEEDGPDFDFGAAMVLAETSSGREFVLGPQKSGTVHAVDPDTGKLLWQTRLGRGGLHGGIHFGIAVSGDRVFVPINDAPDTREYERQPRPGLYAVDLNTGATLWQAPLADECRAREFCAVGIGAAITATDDLVIAGALDGYLRIHDARTGELLRKIDTTEPVVTVSGVTAHGGSMDGAAAPLPHQGALIINSGYNFAGHMPGNVLLVYEVADER